MGRPSIFNTVEVGEMEGVMQAHRYRVPPREVLEALSLRFSASADRAGKVGVSAKQVLNWFHNRRCAIRAKVSRDQTIVRSLVPTQQPQAPPQSEAPQTSSRMLFHNPLMMFEAKSGRDGAWHVVMSFLSHRSSETGDLDFLVRYSGLGSEKDEWVNIHKQLRQRSLQCVSSDCVEIFPGDLILCFQEGKEQALHFDAHVVDVQRRKHDARGCRCRFLVRYDHDQSEEIVLLWKIFRRPETDLLHDISPDGYSQKAVGIDEQATASVTVVGESELLQSATLNNEGADIPMVQQR